MTNNRILFSLLTILSPSLAYGAGASASLLYGLTAVGFVTILFGIYALIRSGKAMKQLTEAVAGATPQSGNDHIVKSIENNEGFSASPTPEEGFSGTDFSEGLDVFDDEKDLLINHEYDGIQELNNKLPPWWVGLFWISTIIGIAYFAYYHILTDWSADKQYQEEMALAQKEVDAYIAKSGGAITENNVTLLDAEADIAKGKEIYTTNCVACHLADGGGVVGPNLTDEYWIHGGGIKEVFTVVKNGGRPGKGMVSWKAILSSKEMQQVSSYVLTFQGTTPATPREKEGELYKLE